MNSYPHEFLAHPQPLMFVAGLTPAARERARSTSNTSATASAATHARSGSTSGDTPRASISPSKDTTSLPFTSPVMEASKLAPAPAPAPAPAAPPADARDDEFETLKSDLCAVFSRFGGPGEVWVPEGERQKFRVALVDKNVRMPLRKMAPTTPGEETHSPLSPLTPSSPLYPDGLIAPVWIRKHAELVPSVFVLFLRLFETPPREPGASPLGDEVLASAEREREKEADDALIKEIAERRQRLNDRGIKLTVVLMASAATLDSPGLDQRLSHLRRASQLSAKASLFVLTPVPATELPDFVKSLHEALYDSAMEYYAAHGKRVRRKRGRVSSIANQKEKEGRSRAASISVQSKPLGPQGWTVRYDFKAGWFAEVRGELDLARRHYEDCWNELAKMFSSTTILPPRTKRWAEGKVLADCVALRICKLLLYENAGNRVLVPYFVHLRRFGELSRGWGIGEETFEFWSWVARQYRLLGEVLDMAVQNGFTVPPLPTPTFPPPPAQPSLDALLPNSSNNLMHILHPPEFYFYAAACCTIERKARLQAALDAESRGGTALTAAPGFANEKKVNHSALIVELLTTAFNLLKDAGQEESGLALYIAFRTAQVHADAGNHELALRFLDRLADKFAAENWHGVLCQLRALEYTCSQATGNVETAARLLFEMLAPNSGVQGEERATLQDDVLSLFQTTVPSTSDPIVLELGNESFIDVRTGFRSAEGSAGTGVPFQLSISPPADVDISKLEFSSLRIGFSDDRPDLVINNAKDAKRVVNVGKVTPDSGVEASAPLTFSSSEPLIVTGELVGNTGEVYVSDATLCLSHGKWSVELHVTPSYLRLWTVNGRAFAPLKGIYPSVTFAPRAHNVKVDVSSAQIAFIGEPTAVTVRVTSTDERELSLSLSVGLQEPSGAKLEHAGKAGTILKDIPIELVDGKGEADLTLTATKAGSHVVDIVLLSTAGDDTTQVVETAVVPVLAPFECTPSISRSGAFATVSAVLRVPARNVTVTSLEITPDAEGVTLVSSSIGSVQLPMTWDAETTFAIAARFKLQQVVQRISAPPGNAAIVTIKWKTDTSGEITTRIPLPPLAPVPPEAFVTATLTAPALVAAHTPFPITLTVSNAHPTDPAYVAVTGDTADGFMWTGPRGARVGPIPPGKSTTVPFEAIAVGNAGWQALPHLSVFHGEGQDRREVRVHVPSDRPLGTVLVQP